MISRLPITSVRDLLKSEHSLVFINFAYGRLGSRLKSSNEAECDSNYCQGHDDIRIGARSIARKQFATSSKART
jgi:hypothetical protein